MYGFSFLIVLALLVAWAAAMFWASMMAIRGKRMWATSLLVIGSGCMLIGTMSVIAGGAISMRSYGIGNLMGIIGLLAGLLIVIGLIVATIGFVGVCARFGLAERRAEELESIVVQLQQRLGSGI